MVILRPLNLRWIQGGGDDPKDLCAHGDIEFRIGDDVLLDPTSGEDVTVSAAGLYLLRTLSVPHTHETPVADHLFTCCGFSMHELPEQDDVVIVGCPNGKDFEVLHQLSEGGVLIRAPIGREWLVSWPEWKRAAFGFADLVAGFYAIHL